MSRHFSDTSFDPERGEYRSKRCDDGLRAPMPPFGMSIRGWASDHAREELLDLSVNLTTLQDELAAAEALADRYTRAGYDAIDKRREIVWPLLAALETAEHELQAAEAAYACTNSISED